MSQVFSDFIMASLVLPEYLLSEQVPLDLLMIDNAEDFIALTLATLSLKTHSVVLELNNMPTIFC